MKSSMPVIAIAIVAVAGGTAAAALGLGYISLDTWFGPQAVPLPVAEERHNGIDAMAEPRSEDTMTEAAIDAPVDTKAPPPATDQPSWTFLNQSGIDSHAVIRFGPAIDDGKWYWEIWLPNIGCCEAEIRETASVGVAVAGYPEDLELGSRTGSWAWRPDGTQAAAGRRTSSGRAASENGDVVMVALDAAKGFLWFGKNGSWFAGGNPATGAKPSLKDVSGNLAAAISSKHGGLGTTVIDVRVGTETWLYRAPRGYKALEAADDR
jgi:hypothetical protein